MHIPRRNLKSLGLGLRASNCSLETLVFLFTMLLNPNCWGFFGVGSQGILVHLGSQRPRTSAFRSLFRFRKLAVFPVSVRVWYGLVLRLRAL